MLWVVEFQKCGLPHVHILVILSEDDQIKISSEVNDIICAELPTDMFQKNSEEYTQSIKLDQIVLKNMVHGPCGNVNPLSLWFEIGKCKKLYPKSIRDKTILDPDNTYPEDWTFPSEKGVRALIVTLKGKDYIIDNTVIVPYSPFLSLRFNCHINVELYLSPTASKYLYKYVYKGIDRSMVKAEVDDV